MSPEAAMTLYFFIIATLSALGVICTLHGIILGFKAHVLMGLLTLIVSPLAPIFSLAKFFANYNIAENIVNSLKGDVQEVE